MNEAETPSLETQLASATDDIFPTILSEERSNTKSYQERYDLLKTKLGSKHSLVEIMAALRSIEQEIKNNTVTSELYDKIILLNRHGKGHVETVIYRATRLALCIKNSKLTLPEIFVLLCAIQIHDIGNIHGRENHTLSFRNEFEEYARESFITESSLIRCVFDVAKVHGGKIGGKDDTIEAANLHYNATVLQKNIRQRLLASILRFADELADDYTRTFDVKIHDLPEYSKLYHAYSGILQSVTIEEEEKEENAWFVRLCYDVMLQEALSSYKKLEKDKNGNVVSVTIPLLSEVIERTKKMERERRYCSRHFLPHIILKRIKVEIVIDMGGLENPKEISYTLEETGYPAEDIKSPSLDDVEKFIANLGEKYNADGGY